MYMNTFMCAFISVAYMRVRHFIAYNLWTEVCVYIYIYIYMHTQMWVCVWERERSNGKTIIMLLLTSLLLLPHLVYIPFF